MIRFSHGVDTSVGRVRRVNEDSYLAVPPIYAVADGMGGHGSGDVASRLAVEALARCVELRPLFTEAVLHALEEANQIIVSRAEPPSRMGTTVTGLAGLETAGGDRLMVFNVGDSRVYRLADDRIEQLTVDHSEVQELVTAGVLTRAQARTHPRRNIVTRALGSGLGSSPALSRRAPRAPLFPAEGARPDALHPRERLAEGDRIGVAGRLGDVGNRRVAFAQALCGGRHAPAREILERRLAHELRESRRERGARHRDRRGKLRDGPGLCRARMHQAQRTADGRIGHGGEPPRRLSRR